MKQNKFNKTTSFIINNFPKRGKIKISNVASIVIKIAVFSHYKTTSSKQIVTKENQ